MTALRARRRSLLFSSCVSIMWSKIAARQSAAELSLMSSCGSQYMAWYVRRNKKYCLYVVTTARFLKICRCEKHTHNMNMIYKKPEFHQKVNVTKQKRQSPPHGKALSHLELLSWEVRCHPLLHQHLRNGVDIKTNFALLLQVLQRWSWHGEFIKQDSRRPLTLNIIVVWCSSVQIFRRPSTLIVTVFLFLAPKNQNGRNGYLLQRGVEVKLKWRLLSLLEQGKVWRVRRIKDILSNW